MMRGVFKLFVQEFKLFLREPVMAFFSLIFPPAIMLLLGFVMGNEPNPLFGGKGSVDISVPAYVGMIIGISAFMALPITLSTYREKGILRRYRTTPLRPISVLAVQIALQYLMTLLGVAMLAVLGKVVFSMAFEGSIAAVFLGFSFSCLSFFSLGLLMASLAPSSRAAVVIGNVVLYPMVYLSGATIPLEVLPKAVRGVARFIPMTHVVTLMRGLWTGEPLAAHGFEFIFLGAMMVICVAAASFLFRWE
jgi:ABC-2 type transport system permease protein